MTIKRNLLLLLILVLIILTASCSWVNPSEEVQDKSSSASKDSAYQGHLNLAPKQILKVNWGSEPPNLDPQTTTDSISMSICNAIYEGLVRKSPAGEIHQGSGLAKSWDISDDQLTYIFYLKDDIKWSDGTEITAHDFAYAWKRAIDPNTGSNYAYVMYPIKNAQAVNEGMIQELDQVGITVIDNKTLEIVLERPTPYFMSLTQFATYLPAQKSAVDRWGSAFGSELNKMVYSGPFIISTWQHEQSLTLEKNPSYWDKDAVILDEIQGDMINNSTTSINMFETDALHMARVPPEMMDKYKDTPEFNMEPESVTWYLQFNLCDPYYSNINIRKALSLSIDPNAYLEIIMNKDALPASGFTPPGIAGYDGNKFSTLRGNVLPQYDPIKAKAYLNQGLAELGISKEHLESHTSLLLGEGTWWQRTGQIFHQMWKNTLGLDVELESVSFMMRLDHYNKMAYQVSLAGWGADYDDPMTFMDLWVSNGGNNNTCYSNLRYDYLIDKAKDLSGQERMKIFIEAEEILGEDLPIYPLFHPYKTYVMKTYVKGLVTNPISTSTEYKWVYIEDH